MNLLALHSSFDLASGKTITFRPRSIFVGYERRLLPSPRVRPAFVMAIPESEAATVAVGHLGALRYESGG
jgi:hypothetical protein